MKDDNSSLRKVLLLILNFAFLFTSLFSQEISLVKCPEEIVKGEKFSVKLDIRSNPEDTLYIIVSVEGDVELVNSFSLDDSILNMELTKIDLSLRYPYLKNLFTGKTFVFADTFKHLSSLRSYAFVMNPKSSGAVKIKFLPLKIYSDSLIYNPSDFENWQVDVDVKNSFEKSTGLCVKFEKGGFMKFKINDKFTAKNGFILSFWIKTTAIKSRIMNFSSADGNPLSVGISSGNLFLLISNSIGKYEIKIPSFISDGKWHNVIICAGQNDNTLRFYIDGEKVEEIYIYNLNFFEMNSPTVRIEQGLIDEVVLFKTYKPNLVDRLYRYFVKFDSDVVFLLKFENETVDISGNVSKLEFKGVNFVPSSAPLCSPDVRVSAEMKENTININWEVDDPTFVDEFVVEKKVGDGVYQPIYRTSSFGRKQYSFLDVLSQSGVVYYYRVKRINKDESYEFSDEVKIGIGLEKDFEIIGNFPNPFNSETKIIYNLFSDACVKLTVYDIVGREIAVLVDGFQTAGRHEVTFNLNSVQKHEMTSGIYFYKLQTQRNYEVRKMIVIK